ncbi:MAG: tetratricopeptide repeat protein [Alphaproteobacteria bacterium]|nr:tetratricopeptide repeat protein [Alphaproteobacteria bacterium]
MSRIILVSTLSVALALAAAPAFALSPQEMPADVNAQPVAEQQPPASPAMPAVPVPAVNATPTATPPASPLTPAPTNAAPPGADENVFFDAEDLVPRSEMATGAPRKVNPVLQPGSSLVIVDRTAPRGSRSAELVSAQRAIKLGRFESALEILNVLYEKNKRDPQILLARAVALQKVGDTESAVLAYEELLRIQPNNTQAQVNMLGLIGDRYPAVALQRIDELSRKNPQSVGLIAQAALLSAKMGRYDDAMKYFGLAAAREPRNPSHIYNMAVIADKSGDKRNAISYYEKALEADTINGGRAIPRESVFERLAQLR